MVVLAVVMFILGFTGGVIFWKDRFSDTVCSIVYIGVNIAAGFNFGAIGVVIAGSIGTILGIVFFVIDRSSGSGYSSSSNYSSVSASIPYAGDYKCGSCQHWASGSGKCFCSGKNNPHYFNGDRMNADSGCEYWEKK